MKKMFSLFSMILLFVSLTQAQSLSLTASPSTVENGADITFTVSGEVGITYYVSSVYTNYIESATSGMLINPATGMTTSRPTKFKCQALFASAGSTSPKQVTFVFDVKVYSQAANGYIDAKLSASVMVNPPPVQVFYNDAKTVNFTKNNCGTGFSGSSVPYTVPANKYSAATKAEANAKADNEISANGQNNANTNGQCLQLYYSTEKSGAFRKNNCDNNGGPGPEIVYTVTAGKYTSTISQAAADQLAVNDVNTNGQAYANVNGTCASAFSLKISTLDYPENGVYPVGAQLIVNFLFSDGQNHPEFQYEIQVNSPDGTVTNYGPQSLNRFRFTLDQAGQFIVHSRTITTNGVQSPWLDTFLIASY